MSLTTNLLHYWKFDESSGNASDSVGSFTLTNTNTVTYSTGKINNGAYTTEAANNYLSANAPETLEGDATVNFWAYISSFSTSSDAIYLRTVNPVWDNYYMITSSNIKYQASSYNSGNQIGDSTWTNTFSTGTWYMITVLTTTSSYTSEVYVNGTSLGTQNFNNSWPSTGKSPRVYTSGSAMYASYPARLNGRIDELGVWSRKLSSSEITSLYNGGSGLQYPFVSGPANLKSLNTNVKANIKSYNTNTLANIKSIDTNA